MSNRNALRAQLAQLNAELAKVERQAGPAIAKVNKVIAKYGLQPSDLTFPGLAPAKKRSARGTGKPVLQKGEPKYRDPKSGKTWTGRGKPPNWFKGAAKPELFLISSQDASKAAGPGAATKSVRSGAAARKAADAVPATKPVQASAPVKAPRPVKAAAVAAKASPAAPSDTASSQVTPAKTAKVKAAAMPKAAPVKAAPVKAAKKAPAKRAAATPTPPVSPATQASVA